MRREAEYNKTTGNEPCHIPASNDDLLMILTEHLPVALYQFLKYPDGTSNFIYISNAITEIFEVTTEDLMKDARALSKRIHPDDARRVNETIDQSVESMQIWDCQFRVVLPKKGLRWIRGVARPEKLDDRGVLSNGYMEDITEQKKANDWIRYLNSALMNISESVIITNMDSKIIYANQKVKELHGYEPDEFIGKPADMMTVNPMSEDEFLKVIMALDQGLTYTGTGLSRRKDGSIFLCEYSLTPIHGNEEATCIGVQRDITERTRIMEALKETNERFEQLTQHSRAIAWEITEDGLFKYVSGAVKTVFGYEPEELILKCNVFDLILPSERERIRDIFRFAMKEDKVFSNAKCPFVGKSGDTIYLSINSIPNEDKHQKTYRGLAIDITEKEKMERQISNENERYKTTLLSVGEGIISTDCDGMITVMNPLAERMTGWSQQEAAGKALTEILAFFDEQTGRLCDSPVHIVLETGSAYQPSYPTVLISKSAKEIPVEIIAAPIKNHVGEISGVVIVLKDFSEYRERQKQIEFLSYHDHLTGLFNRRYLMKAIKDMDIRANLPLTVMTLDVNGLKLTNDAFGHTMGDRLLCTVADVLRKACRADDIIARLGGDEFAILLPQTNAAKAARIKARILQTAMRTKLDTVILSLAIGYSVKTTMQESVENVFTDADKLMYKEKFSQGKTMRNQTIDTVLKNINSKFEQEKIHTERVSQYCYMIASALNLSQREKAEIRVAGLLHDIGKIMVPSELLNKREKLTNEEFDIIKRHPETGYQILKSVDEYITISKYVLHHHERWDGRGYPAGLKGEEIPLQSRIITVADAYEAMTSKRVYQKTRTIDEAKAELMSCSGSQFDPAIVSAFLESVLNEDQHD
jgi:diguanylate cyclase (GGDEF)-like protein/PAS domain S-box-containing protein/putative nucleotidyltransferase with HDIG domain